MLTQILRNELGFNGFVTSDWGANHATTYLSAGLDLEMPGTAPAAGVAVPTYFTVSAVRAALSTGALRHERIDQAVRRLLRQYQRFGLLDRAGRPELALPGAGEPRQQNAAIVLQTARDAATLLKNDAASLPLSRNALANLLLIGPGAQQTIATFGGGEKPGGHVARQVGAYRALQARLRDDAAAHVSFELAHDLAGAAIPAAQLSHAGKPGLLRVRKPDDKATLDARIAFTASEGGALPAGSHHEWSGTLHAPEAGDYDLNIAALGATAKLIVDGKVLNVVGSGLTEAPRYGVVHPTDGNAPVPTPDGLANSRARLHLTRGPHSLQVIERADLSGKPVQVRLAWQTPRQRAERRAAAVAAARAAHTAVVFVWSAGDLSAPLPEEQDQLVAEVAQANPNTIVVLNTSQPVTMPWLSSVKAVLQMWYPGDEGGWATADVLLGNTNPGGRLPFTWPKSIDQTLAHQSEHPERSSAGVGGHGPCAPVGAAAGHGHGCGLTQYSEGLNIGYRFFDATGQEPLYALGYGLSYTTFEFSELSVTPSADGSLWVGFRVRNTGARDGDVVPQVYLGAVAPLPKDAQFARRVLAGFTRMHVPAKTSLGARIQVAPRQLQYWSLTHGWTRARGERRVYLAHDARHVALQTKVTIGAAP